jgi:N-acetylglucosamine kinase-like BadF-type ATPase
MSVSGTVRPLDLCAIDAGQTGIRYLVWSEGRQILSGSVGAGMIHIRLPGAADALRANLGRIVERAAASAGCAAFRVVAAGCTGVSRERAEYGAVREVLAGAFPGALLLLESDLTTSHAAHFQGGAGIVLHAGTGDFAYGVDRHGRKMRVGGWGYLLGDEGAGFGLGLAGLRAALRAGEGSGPATGLREDLPAFFGIERLASIPTLVYSSTFQRRQIADFARHVLDWAERGDAVAREILRVGSERMAGLVDPILRSLDFEAPQIVLTGGLFTRAPSYYERTRALLMDRLTGKGEVRPGTRSPLDGALWLGLNALERTSARPS